MGTTLKRMKIAGSWALALALLVLIAGASDALASCGSAACFLLTGEEGEVQFPPIVTKPHGGRVRGGSADGEFACDQYQWKLAGTHAPTGASHVGHRAVNFSVV